MEGRSHSKYCRRNFKGVTHGHLLQSPTTLLPVQPSASPTYPHIHMPASSKISLHPQATVTVEHARTDTAIQLAIDFYYANHNTTTTVLYPRNNWRSPNRIKKTGISIRRVAAMHKIPFSQLQRAIAAGGELQTRSEAHEAEMRLTIAEEAALEEWCLAMYRWGSPVRLDILRCCVCLPPHSTHLLQPLDVGVFSPLNSEYSKVLT